MGIALLLAGCGGGAGTGTNPFIDNNTETTDNGTGTDTTTGDYGDTGTDTGSTTTSVINSNGTPGSVPVNTTNTPADMSLSFVEGEIQNVRYVIEPDENGVDVEKLYIDNLPFDGVTSLPYIRDDSVETQPGVGQYKSVQTITDSVSGEVFDQVTHRALYGKSETGATEFVIVKALYLGEGFGGHAFQRNQYDVDGAAVVYKRPANSQAGFRGAYDGILKDTKAIQFYKTSGVVDLLFDFDDFNDNGALYAEVNERHYLDTDGIKIALGDIGSVISNAGALQANGEYAIDIFVRGDTTNVANGTLKGVLVGDVPVEAVGIFDLTGTEGDLSYIETGGFFAYRKAQEN